MVDFPEPEGPTRAVVDWGFRGRVREVRMGVVGDGWLGWVG